MANNIPDKIQLDEIRKIVELRKNEPNPHNDTYVRRLACYPQFLQLPYWTDYVETVYMMNSPYVKGKILDFGCGSGHLDLLLARSGRLVTGVDLSSIAIDIANYIKSIEDDEVKSRLNFYLEDIAIDPIVYHEFDCCISTHVFEHIPDISKIMQGIRKRLKPGSYMLISVPIGYAYNDPDHCHHFMNEDELRRHFEPYVEVVSIERDSSCPVFRAILKF
ncbi:MAG: class I SAM-dependent methyltransferase [Peptostreptococcaceae bacterium]